MSPDAHRYDVIVIGTGVSGQTAAEELATAGLRVLAVDRREFGGTCSLRGCHPKKILVSSAEVVERGRDQAGSGLRGAISIDWPSLIAFKRTFTDPAPRMIEQAMTGAGATAIHGAARFTGPDSLDIDGVAYSADHIVVATGARPMDLGIPGADLVIDNEAFMAAGTLGARIVFIGGGYISFEFAHIAAAAGARATVLHRGAQVLKGFDPDLADMLVRGYRERGIDVRTDAPVAEVRRAGDGLEVVLTDGSTVRCDTVVHGAGRVPDLEGLDFAAGDVAFTGRGIDVDAGMRSTTNPRVCAVGDAAALGQPLTPVGVAQARVAVRNILQPGSAEFDGTVVPSVVFADPPLASVGLTEAGAAARGIDVLVAFNDTSTWESSKRVGVRVSGAKVLVERATGRIVGAHLLEHNADEVINVFAAAMLGGLTADQLKASMWAYPTAGSEIVYLV